MAPPKASSKISFVDAPSLPDPQWYSHGVSLDGTGRLILTSGQIAQRKDGTFPSIFGEQVKQAITNLTDVLKAAGAFPRDIVQLRFYCVDWSMNLGHDLIEPVIALLTESYGMTYRPLTTLVPVPKLAFEEVTFEIEAVASVGGRSRPWVYSDGHLPGGERTAITNSFPVPASEVDVVVVGGGFSGLMAGYESFQAGLETVVLEARNRVGGRSYSSALKNGPGVIELGGTWINKTTQPVVYGLTKKFDLETEEQYTTGAEVFQGIDGTVSRVEDALGAQDVCAITVAG
jgi:monoamine oxidase